MDVAQDLSGTLVREGLAACVNILPAIRSIYVWDGELCDDEETLLIIKTTRDRSDELQQRVASVHPYDCPEVIMMAIQDGLPDYLSWLVTQTRPAATSTND